MASVQQMKDQLAQQQVDAIEAYEVAVSAISTIGATAAWSIGFLTALVAIVAVVGWLALWKMTQNRANQVARRVVDDYLKSEDFSKELEKRVAAESAVQRRATSVTPDTNGDDADPFPTPPKLREEG